MSINTDEVLASLRLLTSVAMADGSYTKTKQQHYQPGLSISYCLLLQVFIIHGSAKEKHTAIFRVG
jgi:hypothetical protein